MTGQTIERGWTDERTATAKRLWLEGASASDIARQLGGVTRNAVIGKVNRMGLTRSPEANAATYAHGSGVVARLRRSDRPRRQPVAAEPTTAAEPPHQAPAVPELVRVFAVDGLTKQACKWPIGDPASKGFGFCGARCAPGAPYCPDHKGRAASPDQERNPRRVVRDLERNLRRYLA